jgi:RimJ/RimL family protein N-acetyltransferase
MTLPSQMRRGDALALAVIDTDDDALLASIDLRIRGEGRGEFGYVVASWARRRGVGTRALRLFSGYAFDQLGLARLELLVQPDNLPSLALAHRAGFTREGVLRMHSLVREGRRDMVMLSLLPGELGGDS